MSDTLQTLPVAEANRFDTVALQRYLAERAAGFEPGREMQVRQFPGGQSNPTFLVEAADGRRWVLRKKPSGSLLPSAHAIEREYRVISALQGSAVPVAPALCLCEDASVIGTPFYVMGHVAGRILWDPALPGFTPADRAALYDDVNRIVAALHRVDVGAAGLADYGRPGGYLARQITRWTHQYRASQTQPMESMDRLIEWLPAQVPASAASALVHGDLRLDNLIVHPAEPRVLAVLDWELSTLGDPLADLSYHMLPWHLRADEFRGMAGNDLASLGIPDEAEYLRRYCGRVGIEPVDGRTWEVYLIYNLFRLAAILQGIAKRVEDGTAASASARETGARARPIADIAWRRARELAPAG
jgi:aminoglycoside phosphotransferase (APT) family kinase protein